MNILFRGGGIATETETTISDLLVVDDKIADIGLDLPVLDAKVVDCDGLILLPGGVDPHAHFSLSMFNTISSDNHFTGHRAAAFGGTTTVMDFTSQSPGEPLQQSIDLSHSKASEMAAVDYSFHVNVTDFSDDIANEIKGLPSQGLTTLKVFTAYNGRLRISDQEIAKVLNITRENGMLVMIHVEDGDEIDRLVDKALSAGHTEPIWHAHTRPAHGEVLAGSRAIEIAENTKSSLYIVHITTAGLLNQLTSARKRGVQVMGETCPQYLFFAQEKLLGPDGANWVCSPPLRALSDNGALWHGLSDGSIQTVGTDHCPFFADGENAIEYDGQQLSIPGKELGKYDFTRIPNGLPSIEHRMSLLWTFGVSTGKLSVQKFVKLTASNPARIFGLYPRKGALMPGSDADIVLWDPSCKHTISINNSHMRTDHELWEGIEVKGYPLQVYLRGHLLVDRDKWLGNPGFGQFIHRQADAQIL